MAQAGPSLAALWRGDGREECRETPTAAAALSPAHHVKLSQKPGEGQGQARGAGGALQEEKEEHARDPAEPRGDGSA